MYDIINGNIEDEFIELIELGKEEIKRALPIIKEKYGNDYVATKQYFCLKEEFSEEWKRRVELLYFFSNVTEFTTECEMIDRIKIKGNYIVQLDIIDIPRYFNKILNDFYDTVKPKVMGYNKRILWIGGK